MAADRFTRDVIAAALDAAATEMFEVLRKTAMSPIITEVLDVSTGITDATGALVSSGAGIPSFVGVLDKSVQAILAKMGDTLAPGDVFVTNDPNFGGVTHLNDVVIARPVFWDGACVAWVASIAHWSDIGGRTPGSMAVDTTELIAEGLRLPILRLFEAGRPNRAVFDIIRTNSRLPDFLQGDLWAQVSAAARAAGLVETLCQRYGTAALRASIAEAREIGEKRARVGLATLPKGRFEIAEPQDDGSTWHALIDITSDAFTVDLRAAPVQTAGPYNTSRDGAVVACQLFFKALCDPDRFANAGSFAPLKVLTRPGTIFHATDTAPHAYYFETRLKLVDMLWHCMANAMPGALPSGHFGSIFGTVIAGEHPDTGRRSAMVQPQMGGWGTTQSRAGQNAMFSTSHSDTFNCPIEIAEARCGFEVEASTLSFGPETARALPGGAGLKTTYRMRARAVLSSGYSHADVPVWGQGSEVQGGRNSLEIKRDGTNPIRLIYASNIALNPGDTMTITTAFGGGFCATRERFPTHRILQTPEKLQPEEFQIRAI